MTDAPKSTRVATSVHECRCWGCRDAELAMAIVIRAKRARRKAQLRVLQGGLR